MSRNTVLKYAQVAVIVLLAIFVDQWTKSIAETRLATQRPGYFSHNVILIVPEEDAGKTLKEFLSEEFTRNTPEEIARIAGAATDDAAVMIFPGQKLEAGQTVEVRHREIVVIPGYWDFQYTRNPGAAFSFLADTDSPWRTPFFIGVSLIAVLMILWILHGVTIRQQLLIWGLSLICGGAIGNLIDRVRLGYVIDFIVWKYTDEYRWPTFNLADAFICVGVTLMVIEMIRSWLEERKAGEAAEET